MIHFVLHEATDTVAVAVVEGIKPGADLTAWIMDDDKQFPIRALQEIPIGHKIALKDMAVGDTVLKYGTDIGRVVAPIKAGEHAHVHNIKTKRW
jgi:(2R)-sulfolactate sulfo-lyase subunit alpha